MHWVEALGNSQFIFIPDNAAFHLRKWNAVFLQAYDKYSSIILLGKTLLQLSWTELEIIRLKAKLLQYIVKNHHTLLFSSENMISDAWFLSQLPIELPPQREIEIRFKRYNTTSLHNSAVQIKHR